MNVMEKLRKLEEERRKITNVSTDLEIELITYIEIKMKESKIYFDNDPRIQINPKSVDVIIKINNSEKEKNLGLNQLQRLKMKLKARDISYPSLVLRRESRHTKPNRGELRFTIYEPNIKMEDLDKSL
jgi:hypothetical protein